MSKFKYIIFDYANKKSCATQQTTEVGCFYLYSATNTPRALHHTFFLEKYAHFYL